MSLQAQSPPRALVLAPSSASSQLGSCPTHVCCCVISCVISDASSGWPKNPASHGSFARTL